MIDLYPYIVSVLCALIAGLSSYVCARRQAKAEITKLDRQFTIDLKRSARRLSWILRKNGRKTDWKQSDYSCSINTN